MEKIINYTKPHWQLHSLGDHAIVFSVEEIMDQKIIAQIMQLTFFIQSKNVQGIKDIIPSYHTVTIVFDITQFLHSIQHLFLCSTALEFGNQLLIEFLNDGEHQIENKIEDKIEPTIIKLPVCYDLSLGIDLLDLSISKKISTDQIIHIHTSTLYHVFCLGFMPGFAYMGKVNESIQMNRHAKPRPLVHAGSVGIAGSQTGIYPLNSPGGWQIIGRTPIKIFDPIKLAKFKVGDCIQFYSIDMETYLATNQYPKI